MVDFQSRDTSRSVDDESGDETGNEEAVDEESATAQEAAPPSTEPADAAPEQDSNANDGVAVAILVTDEEADAADEVADTLASDHEVLGHDRRTGDLDSIQTAVNTFLDQPSVDAVVTVGGVSVGATQVTVDAVKPLLDSELPGFGELFRRRYESVADSAALRTRAFAGIAATTPVFCLPGDREAARVASEELVGPELDWLVAAASDV